MAAEHSFRFIKGRRDTNLGLLIIDDSYKMISIQALKDSFRYVCSEYRTIGVKCKAKARVKLCEGEPVVSEVDEHTCRPNKPLVIAEIMKSEIKDKVSEDPSGSIPLCYVQKYIDQVRIKYAKMYQQDYYLWLQVNEKLGSDQNLTRLSYRTREKIPRTVKVEDEMKLEIEDENYFDKEDDDEDTLNEDLLDDDDTTDESDDDNVSLETYETEESKPLQSKKPWLTLKCPSCNRGFNSQSKEPKPCSSCNIQTHLHNRCLAQEKENLFCKICKPGLFKPRDPKPKTLNCEMCFYIAPRSYNLKRHIASKHSVNKKDTIIDVSASLKNKKKEIYADAKVVATNCKFLKGRNDNSPGLLIVAESYKMKCTKGKAGNDKFNYVCSFDQTLGIKCGAKAIVLMSEGEPVVASVTQHDCKPNRPHMIAQSIRAEMKEKVLENPQRKVQISIDETREKYRNIHNDENNLWKKISDELGPDRIIQRALLHAKHKALGQKKRKITIPRGKNQTVASGTEDYTFLPGLKHLQKKANPGLLILENSYQFRFTKKLKSSKTFWYLCSEDKTEGMKCLAMAKVQIIDGKPTLVSYDEDHTCLPNKPKMIVKKMMAEMRKKVSENCKISQAIKQVKLSFEEKFKYNEIWPHVLKKVENSRRIARALDYYRPVEKNGQKILRYKDDNCLEKDLDIRKETLEENIVIVYGDGENEFTVTDSKGLEHQPKLWLGQKCPSCKCGFGQKSTTEPLSCFSCGFYSHSTSTCLTTDLETGNFFCKSCRSDEEQSCSECPFVAKNNSFLKRHFESNHGKPNKDPSIEFEDSESVVDVGKNSSNFDVNEVPKTETVTAENVNTEKLKAKINIATFLQNIGLNNLIENFIREDIDLELLQSLGEDDLNQIRIGLNISLGNMFRIKIALKETLKQNG